VKLIKKEHKGLMPIMLLRGDHVLKHCTMESSAKDLKESSRPHVARRISRPEPFCELFVCATQSGILGITLVDP
jgi:hypothetical protein